MIDTEFIRLDGRKTTDLRELEIEVGLLDRADGSAQVKLGKNIVLAAVNGPMELHPKHSSLSQKAVVRVTYRMMPFSVEYRKNPFPSRREKEISKVLSEAFESVVITKMFPRAAIDVHVQMIQADGGSRTAASIAVSAALADAGIPMRALIGGIASGLYEDKCCLDLSGIEDNVGSGDMPILYSSELDEVSLFQLDGRFTLEQFKTCFNMSIDAIDFIVEKQKEALRKKYLTVKDIVKDDIDELNELPKEEFPSEITDISERVEEPTNEIASPTADEPAMVTTNEPVMVMEEQHSELKIGEESITEHKPVDTPTSETIDTKPVETKVMEDTIATETTTESVGEVSRYKPSLLDTQVIEQEEIEEEPSFVEEDITPIAEPIHEDAVLPSEGSSDPIIPSVEDEIKESPDEIAQEISNRYSLDVTLEDDDDLEDEEAKRIAEKIHRDLEIQDFELGDDE